MTNWHRAELLVVIIIFYFLLRIILSSRIKYNPFSTRFSLLTIVTSSFAVQGAAGLLQFLGILSLTGVTNAESVLRGTVSTINGYAALLSSMLPFVIVLYNNSKNSIIKKVLLMLILVGSFSLLLTISRAAWIAVLCGLAVLYSRRIKMSLRHFGHNNSLNIVRFFLLLSCFFLLLVIFIFNTQSNKGRILIWSVTVEMIRDQPVWGVGYGLYETKYLQYQRKFFHCHSDYYYRNATIARHSHNIYLQILAETGIFGLFVFLAFVLSSFTSHVLVQRNISKGRENFQMTDAAAISAAIILIHGLFDSTLFIMPLPVIFVTDMAILNTSLIPYVQKQSQPGKYSAATRAIIVTIILLTSAAGIYNTIRKSNDYIIWGEADSAAKRYQWKKANEMYNKVLIYSPDEGKVQYKVAIVNMMMGNYNSALIHLERAERTFGDQQILYARAEIYERLGRITDAEEILINLRQTFPEHLLPRFLLGKLYWRAGEKTKAVEALNETLKINPKYLNRRTKIIRSEALSILKKIERN